jgi:collagen type III alpha
VDGRVPVQSGPEAVRLLYRHSQHDPYEERPMELGQSYREWTTTLGAAEVHNGFWYKVAGGDDETEEQRVLVRSTPLVTGFDVSYHYRPYLKWRDRTSTDPNLQDLRGTAVDLRVHTNRAVREGQLTQSGERPISGELIPDQPQSLRFKFVLEKDNSYQIWFTSSDGERNSEPVPYAIRVTPDQPPQLELTKPGQDSQIPANGTLQLEGSASDDFGIAGMTLKLKLADNAQVQAK